MPSPWADSIGRIGVGTILCLSGAAAGPIDLAPPPVEALPPERPLQAVLDAAAGRVGVNRSSDVRFEHVSGVPTLRFTLVNRTRRKQAIRIGVLHLPRGRYDIHTLGVAGPDRHIGLSSRHLAAGWRFALAPPQTETPFGKAVRLLGESVRRSHLMLADRSEPELTRALSPLASAVRRAQLELEATRQLRVAIVRTGTRTVPLPPRGPALSDSDMDRRWTELDRLRQQVIAAADRTGDTALANRIRQCFQVRIK